MKRKFTLLELNIVTGIAVLLLAQIPVAVQSAKRGVLEEMCLANKKKAYTGVMQYCNDFNGLFFIQDSQKLWHGVLASSGRKLMRTDLYTDLNLRYMTLDAATCPAVSVINSCSTKENWGMGYGMIRVPGGQMREKPAAVDLLGDFLLELRRNECYYGDTRKMKKASATPLLMDTWHCAGKKGFPFFARRNDTVGAFLIHDSRTGTVFADGSLSIAAPDDFREGFKMFSAVNRDFSTLNISY